MRKIDLSKEYSKILAKYLKIFKLESIDIAYLIRTKKDVIDGLLKNEKSVVLFTLEQIAQIFGLRYFEFGNPNHPIPSFDSLPEKTKLRIAQRKKEGPAIETTYTTSEINDQIKKVLSGYNVGDEFLAEDIANSILEKYGVKYTVTEIINRFGKSFKDSIEKTDRKDTTREGRGPKPVFYKLKKKNDITQS